MLLASALETLTKLGAGIGSIVGILGIINLIEGFSNDNPTSKNQGGKQFMAGAGIVIIALTLIPQLSEFFVI